MIALAAREAGSAPCRERGLASGGVEPGDGGLAAGAAVAAVAVERPVFDGAARVGADAPDPELDELVVQPGPQVEPGGAGAGAHGATGQPGVDLGAHRRGHLVTAPA